MKILELKKFEEIVVVDNQQIKTEIKYSDLIKSAVNTPVEGGYTVSEIAQRIRILDIIESAEKIKADKVEFEDSDFSVLSNLVKNTKWSVISRTIVNFVNEFNN